MTDLPETDLKAITSLLLHYTCIYDRRDVLTSPLCYSLSAPTQIIIRNFLQKFNKEFTNSALNVLIEQCLEEVSLNLNNHWINIGGSIGRNSPLQDLLKTPVSKFGRLHEKEKNISDLKSALELERYEKADLQEELRLQIDKNLKIGKFLSKF